MGNKKSSKDTRELNENITDSKRMSIYSNTSTEEKFARSQKKEHSKGLLKAHKHVVKRNALLTQLLDTYISNSILKRKQNTIFRAILFCTFILVLILLSISTFVIFIRINLNSISINSAVSLLSVVVSFLGTIFATYKVILKYVFPPKEEENMIKLIETIIVNDAKVEELASKMNQSNDDKTE